MAKIGSMKALEELGRIRLSANFFFRDFLYSEISNFYGIPNLPVDAKLAVETGSRLCEELLEPLQATFGRIHIRSAYRSPTVNEYGNRNKLNCGSNEANAASHIWDLRDRNGFSGATACIAIPWIWDRYRQEGDWQKLAWWIRDHLPYGSLEFFPKLWAFNIQWHENPGRVISSFAEPRGILTRPGKSNFDGDHSPLYAGFPTLASPQRGVAHLTN